MASSAHPVLAFPPSQDSPAVMAAPGQGPELGGGGCPQAGGHWDQAVSQRPPIWPSPQSARLSTVRPASATTSAPSVRRACTCTRAAAIRPVPRARRPPTAPWSAAVLVSLQGGPVGPEGWDPGEEQGEPTYLPTRTPPPTALGFQGLSALWTEHASSLRLRQKEQVGGAPLGHSGVPRSDPLLPFFLSLFPPFLPAQCEMSEWSLWGPCSKKKRLCGFRRGSEERTRRVLHAPGGDHAVCSDTKETRRCTVRRTPCPEGELWPLPPGGWESGTAMEV